MLNFYNTLPLLFIMFGSGLLYFMKDTIYVKDYYYHFFDKDDKIDILSSKIDNQTNEIRDLKDLAL